MSKKTNKHVSEEALEKEIESRISQLEAQDYDFPKRFSRSDYIVTAVFAAACLALVVAGAFIV